MSRNTYAQVGTINVAANGYQYTKQRSGWILTHHLIAAKARGKKINTSVERVIFIDKDKTNLSPDNIKVMPKKNGKQQRIANLKERIQLLQEELHDLEKGR